MSAVHCVVVADNLRPPRGFVPRGSAGKAGYEPGHSERQCTGSVAAGADSFWYGTLAVPMTGDQSVLLNLQREGSPQPGAPVVSDVSLVIPPGEIDAVVTLLRGLVAQARRDGVLGRRPLG